MGINMKSVEIIVDVGINHMGNMNIARKLIHDAAECRASICKFQWYSVQDLFNNPDKDTFRPDIYEVLKPFELNEEKIEKLMYWCEEDGIEFMCSVFDNERFEKLDRMGVKKHKVASRVSKYDRLLAEKILKTGKQTFVSLGFGAEPFDTKKYPNCYHLYCVAKYPAEYSDFKMPKTFDWVDSDYYGFSSHASTPYPSMVALARGAKCIEVHFTMDKSMAALPGGFDHICSLDKTELKQLVDFSKHAEKIK